MVTKTSAQHGSEEIVGEGSRTWVRMAFLDNPAIILAHIRQSHVTSDDTGMCEMVLIDHDVDLERFHPASANGEGSSEGPSSNGEPQGYVYSQSVDITSSWDFGIRRRSNTAQRLERLRKERQNQIKCKNVQWKERNATCSAEELSRLFEKKNFKVKPVHTPVKPSILSVRLEQCPLQLNNPFNEYSKFDGKVSESNTPLCYLIVVVFSPIVALGSPEIKRPNPSAARIQEAETVVGFC
ncbi:target of rapamycin complex 2 subunit MAPKAP1 [Pituophis catenifer annectens]|uniref:target of rapamycin complex 2 subunit MAPKAP1 n=1 Tax=Pituophis catenifer annectens TaxID=94852 RepID=UPI003991D2CB